MRTVLVSGGGTGIGRATARAFARCGDSIHILGRRQDVLAETAEGINIEVGRDAVHTHAADLTDVTSIEGLLPQLPQEVDVLVNNAGGSRGRSNGSLREIERYVRAGFEDNFLPVALLTESVLDRLTRPGGRIVSISSIAALRGGGLAYASAKAAILGLTYTLASELGADGITVNAVAPGYITDTDFFGDSMTAERHESLVVQTFTGRPGTPDDVAAAIVYLASPEARQVTAQVLQVNGGALPGRG
jgi:3-oxoacyl-[acyl-carrier protein] reductase